MVDLADKPIAITGASSGIGMATALACARARMPVAVGARREDRLKALVDQVAAEGGRAIAVGMDVDDPEDCRRLIEHTVEAFGSIYGIMANAGYGLERAIHEMAEDELRCIFETNFFGTMNTVRAALPHLLSAGTGHVIIVSSCLSKLGTPYHGAYSATKAAQDHIARAMRLELAGTGVLVSSVHPIGTKTEFFTTADTRSGGSAALHTPEFFMQSPERVAQAVVAQLRRGRAGEVWTSRSVRCLAAVATAFPGLADRILRSHVARRSHHYRPSGDQEGRQV